MESVKIKRWPLRLVSIVAVISLALGITGVILATSKDSSTATTDAPNYHVNILKEKLRSIPNVNYTEVDGLISLKTTNEVNSNLDGKTIAVVCGLRANDFDGIDLCLDLVARNELSKSVNFEIFPLVNQAGYEYAKSTDQSWTRNRNMKPCPGVNLARNFDSDFNANLPCDDSNYGGEFAESETETSALAKALLGHGAVFTVESGSSKLVTPYYRNTNLFRQMGNFRLADEKFKSTLFFRFTHS